MEWKIIMLCTYEELKKKIKKDIKDNFVYGDKIYEILLNKYKGLENCDVTSEIFISMFLLEIYKEKNMNIDKKVDLLELLTKKNLEIVYNQLQDEYMQFSNDLKEILRYVFRNIDNDIATMNDKIILDLREIYSKVELHEKLKKELKLPNFYKNEWDSFKYIITDLISLPSIIIIKGWKKIQIRFPNDAKKMQEIFVQLNKEHPEINCEIIYD